MISKAASIVGEVAADITLFFITFFLTTGIACGTKASCDQPRDQTAEVRTP